MVNNKMTNHQLAYEYLKHANVFILKRIEIMNLLNAVNNKTYDWFVENETHFDSMIKLAKKLRVSIKYDGEGIEPLKIKKTDIPKIQELLKEIGEASEIIAKDIRVVNGRIVKVLERFHNDIKKYNLEGLIHSNSFLIKPILQDLDYLRVMNKEVTEIINDLISKNER